jgi:hypothetical protein
MPNDFEEELAGCLFHLTRDPAASSFVWKLNTIEEEATHESVDTTNEQGEAGTQSRDSADYSSSSGANLKAPSRPYAVK